MTRSMLARWEGGQGQACGFAVGYAQAGADVGGVGEAAWSAVGMQPMSSQRPRFTVTARPATEDGPFGSLSCVSADAAVNLVAS
jgi:hypothetical protein